MRTCVVGVAILHFEFIIARRRGIKDIRLPV